MSTDDKLTKQLQNMYELHLLWLDSHQKEGSQFKLHDLDLHDSEFFRDKRLDHCVIENVNLSGVHFGYAGLRKATFKNVDMSNTQLYSIMLDDLILDHVNLDHATIGSNTKIYYNYWDHVSLDGTRFGSVQFIAGRIRNTDFSNIEILYSVNFWDTKFENVTGPEMVCPAEGSFIGYKKVVLDFNAKFESKTLSKSNDRFRLTKFQNKYDCYIIKLEIPADAKRSSAMSNKCRCSKAKVLDILTLDGEETDITLISTMYDSKVTTSYEKGHMVYPDLFDDNRWNECSHGIHFFMTFDEAVKYMSL